MTTDLSQNPSAQVITRNNVLMMTTLGVVLGPTTLANDMSDDPAAEEARIRLQRRVAAILSFHNLAVAAPAVVLDRTSIIRCRSQFVSLLVPLVARADYVVLLPGHCHDPVCVEMERFAKDAGRHIFLWPEVAASVMRVDLVESEAESRAVAMIGAWAGANRPSQTPFGMPFGEQPAPMVNTCSPKSHTISAERRTLDAEPRVRDPRVTAEGRGPGGPAGEGARGVHGHDDDRRGRADRP